MATNQTSDIYWACRNGDVGVVKKLLATLKLTDINRVESNGSTALHAASYYGHANVVRLLLERGADTTIRNKYDQTAKEEASTDEVRAIFNATVMKKEVEDDDDDEDIPQSASVQLYPNPGILDKSTLATRILKTRVSTYHAHKYSIAAASNMEALEKKYRKVCQEQGEEDALRMGEAYFKKYRKTGDFAYIIKFYTTESPFYGMVRDDETFIIEMYRHLLRDDTRAFQGRSYRGWRSLAKDLEPFQWALTHPGSLLEMRQLTRTTEDSYIALQFTLSGSQIGDGKRRFFLEMNFDEKCFTALEIGSLSEYQGESEILILSGTFFEVTQIREDPEKQMTIISLKNVPVDKDAVLAVL